MTDPGGITEVSQGVADSLSPGEISRRPLEIPKLSQVRDFEEIPAIIAAKSIGKPPTSTSTNCLPRPTVDRQLAFERTQLLRQ